MEDLTRDYDDIQQTLSGEDTIRQHSLMRRIDRWEAKSIDKIRQVARGIRQNLRHILDELMKNIGDSLHHMTNELQESRRTEVFIELDLRRWTSQLKNFREKLDNLPMIEVKSDEDEASVTHLPLVQLQIIKQNRGI